MTLKDENTNLEVNYDGLEKISWCNTDCQNLMNYAGQIFRGGMGLSDAKLVSLLAAAKKAIIELNVDIKDIEEHLNTIIPIVPESQVKKTK
jgi:hypothetical protein